MAFKPTKSLLVKDWKQDVIYLVQLPRTHLIPNPSPFSLKLETWIRMNGLTYRNVSNELSKGSAKGQIPFIELNGRQFADSNQIIEHLRNHFKLSIDTKLNSLERAHLRAYTILIEESLFRCSQYYRSLDFGWLFTEKGMLSHAKGLKKVLAQKFGAKKLQKALKNTVHVQGYGRHSPLEIDEIAKKDLIALSTLLGDKAFLFGSTPSTLDATLFGLLAQFTDTPSPQTIMSLLEKSTPNLLSFVQLIKRRYWPDWNEINEKLILNPEDSEEKKEQK
ncbi:hypothetical protein ACQ4LE_010013 [Meloidogyne hapla]|uniref:GST N-terminal domain-containing protein n=1 Tax=Meloidogyne hapla TaxID=6305 RepID=A0A1I8BEH0_MELHA